MSPPNMAISSTNPTTLRTSSSSSSIIPKPYSLSSLTPSSSLLKFQRYMSCPSFTTKTPSISCVLTGNSAQPTMGQEAEPALLLRPDSFGRFGKFGGKYVPETLMHALTQLEAAFRLLAGDHEFQVFAI